MRPFTQRPREQTDQNTWERSAREVSLRALRDEEASQSHPVRSEEPQNAQRPYHPDKGIRNLGIFKEQERQFTQAVDEEEWQERQSPINFVLISCIFIILCIVGWFGYRWASTPLSNEPPLITAEQDPIKVRPENPGGMIIPHQDKLIYGRIEAPNQQQPVEHLLPAPEQPIALAAPPLPQGQPKTFVDASGQVYYAYPVPNKPTQQQNHPLSPQHQDLSDHDNLTRENNNPERISSPQLIPSPLPTPVEPLSPSQQKPQRREQKTLVPPSLPPRSHQHPPLGTVPPPLHREPDSQKLSGSSDMNTLDQLLEQEVEDSPLKHSPQKEDSLGARVKRQNLKRGSSPYKLQVATLESKEEADKEIKRIRAIDKNLFNDKTISIEPIAGNSIKKPLYRIVINGFETPNSATQFSNKLKIHKVKGIVLRQPT